MPKSSESKGRSRPISIEEINFYGICILLILVFVQWLLWIGKPNQVTCENIDSIRIDCTLKYQALLISSEQKIKNVKSIKIDTRTSSSEYETTTYYVAVLYAEGAAIDIKTYSKRNDPELQSLDYRLSEFFKNPTAKLVIPIQYNPW